MQTYLNAISGSNVHSEAVVLVNSSGSPISTLPVSISGSVNVGNVTANAGTNLNTSLLSTEATLSAIAGSLAGVAQDATVGGVITSVDATTVNPGTTFSGGLKGPISQGLASASESIAGDGTIAPISIDTSSRLRVLPTQSNASNLFATVKSPNASNFLTTVAGTITSNQGGTWYVQSINSTSTVNSPNASNFLATITGTVGVNSITNPVTVAQSNASNFLATVAGTVTAVQSNASNFLSTVSGTVGVTANSSFNLSQVLGTTADVNSGNKSAGTLRVVLATDQPQLTNLLKVDASGVNVPIINPAGGKILVTPDANTAFNLAQVTGQACVASVTGVQDVMPRLRDGTTGLSPFWYLSRISTQLNSFPTNATAYVECVKISMSNGVAGSNLTIRDQSGAPNRTFINMLNLATFPNGLLENYQGTLKMTGGININTTGGATPSDLNVFIKYWQ